MGRIIDFIKGTDNYDDDEVNSYEDEKLDEVQDESANFVPASQRASGGISSSTALEMKVCRPSKFEEGPEIATHLINNKTVVLNLEDANRDTIIRLIDFLFGVTFAIEGKLKKVSTSTYIITPKNVEVDGEQPQAAAQPTAQPAPQNKPRDLF